MFLVLIGTLGNPAAAYQEEAGRAHGHGHTGGLGDRSEVRTGTVHIARGIGAAEDHHVGALLVRCDPEGGHIAGVPGEAAIRSAAGHLGEVGRAGIEIGNVNRLG